MTNTIISIISASISVCALISNIVLSRINFARQTIPFIQIKSYDEFHPDYAEEEGKLANAIIDRETSDGEDISFQIELTNLGLGAAKDIIVQYDNGILKTIMGTGMILSKNDKAILQVDVNSETIKKEPSLKVFYKGILGTTYMTELSGVYLHYQDGIKIKWGYSSFKQIKSIQFPKQIDMAMRYCF
ncbi:MAG: hypothetical protein K6F77_09730 [Lachnospiraceae bacterium]|nr:hypothetical protein [Lachnospiraceae bacterium]